MNDKHLELQQYLDSCTEDAEAIAREIFSLRLELRALNEKIRMMRQNLQVINRKLPATPKESELYEYSDCNWLS
jgi:chromosome segregation ATPase